MLPAYQLLGSAIAGGVAACILSGTAYTRNLHTVAIDEFTFKPRQTIVSVGSPITWENHDDVPHTIVATDGAFRSGALDTGDQFSFRFDRVGTFDYFCSLHPQMKGEIVVVP